MWTQIKIAAALIDERLPRLWKTWLVTALLLGVVAWLNSEQIAVAIKKVALLTLGAGLGYGLDRALFPYARPHALVDGETFRMAMLRRAIIVAASVLAIALAA